MGLLSRFLGGADIAAEDRYIDGWLKGIDGGLLSSTGLRVTTADALTVPGISANIQVLSEDLAKVPCILYRRDSRQKATEHPLYWLLKNGPAPWLSSFAWRKSLFHNALAYGNGFSRAWRDSAGRIERITLLQPGYTCMKWQDDGEPFFDVNSPAGSQRNLSWQEILHIPYRGSNDGACHGGVFGVSPIAQNRETIALALAAERFAAKFFANGAKPSAVLQMDKKLPNDEVATRMRAGIERVYSGVDNSFKIAILELGMKLKEFSFDPTKSQMTETRKEQAVQCCTMYRVPPHKIGILDKATFSNIEQQSIDYVTGPISSLAEAFESAVEVACLTPSERQEYYVELNLDGLMRGDLLSRYQAYAIGRQWGWLNSDEIRAWENQDPIPDGAGQDYLVPLNMSPAGTEPPAADNQSASQPTVHWAPVSFALARGRKSNGHFGGGRMSSLVAPDGGPLFLH
jgi:HK97 family phage portal protein